MQTPVSSQPGSGEAAAGAFPGAREQTVSLKFYLGEFYLFSAPLPAVVHFPDLPSLIALAGQPGLPVPQFARGCELVLYHWQPVTEALPRFTMARESIRYVRAQYDHCYIDIQGSFADYVQKFSPKTRSTLARKVKKYAQFSGGRTAWREFSQPGEMEEAYELARAVSAKTYQEKLLHAGLPTRAMFRRQMEDLSQNDAIRCWILFHQEKPVAYLWCPVVAGTLLYEHLGYDPEYSQWSPGTVLQYLVLEKIFSERRFQFFDFGQGDGPHKRFFATSTIRSADIYYFRPHARSALLVGGHIGINALSEGIVGTLDSLGLKSKIKSLFRSGRWFEARPATPENAEPAAERG